MDSRLNLLNEDLKRYDRFLFAKKNSYGMVSIYRSPDPLKRGLSPAPLHPYWICSLTDNWNRTGQPVERGIVQVMEFLRNADGHRHDRLDTVRKNREKKEAIRKNRERNEIRDIAADLRKDFAKATDEYVIGSVQKNAHYDRLKEKA